MMHIPSTDSDGIQKVKIIKHLFHYYLNDIKYIAYIPTLQHWHD